MKNLLLDFIILINFVCPVIFAENDWFYQWFALEQGDQIIDKPIELDVNGVIPAYIVGSLVRVGPSMYNLKKKSYTNFLDGFGRISLWNIDGSKNKIKFLSSMIKSNVYNNSVPNDDIIRHITQQKTDPKTHPGSFDLKNMDNTDVNVYKFPSDNKIMTMTDFVSTNDIDEISLRTLGESAISPESDDVPEGSTFSGSHPANWLNPNSNEIELVNWLGAKKATHFLLSIYTMNSNRIRKIKGSVKLKNEPYSIHSIVVAGDYAVVTIGPVYLDFLKAGATLCISCSAEDHMDNKPTEIYVFHLSDDLDSSIDTSPIASINIDDDPFFVFHHINAIKDDNIIHVDYCSYNTTNGWLTGNILGDISNMNSETIRNNMNVGCDSYTRLSIDYDNQKVVDRFEVPLLDNNGNIYTPELFSINPYYIGKEYCYSYAMAYHIYGSPRMEDMGILKINKCELEQEPVIPVVGIFNEENRYVGEPIFVPDPDGLTEDSGSLMVISRFHNASELLFIDAISMKSVARVTAPFHITFEFHGQFFPK